VTVKEHLSLHDRQIKAIRELLQEGMRLMVETRKELRILGHNMDRLTRNVDRLLEGRIPNGRGKRRID
jgi:hypothetical protein